MSLQKINIVLFGSGKVGSTLVNTILKSQEFLLGQDKDIRVSLVVSSSLVFIENEHHKNAWDVTFIKSSKHQRIGNIVSYIQEKELTNTIIIDATRSNDLIAYYSYFLQNGFHTIALNSETGNLSQIQKDEIKISSEVYEKKFIRLDNFSVTKEQASEFAFQNILKISKKLIQNKIVRQAI